MFLLLPENLWLECVLSSMRLNAIHHPLSVCCLPPAAVAEPWLLVFDQQSEVRLLPGPLLLRLWPLRTRGRLQTATEPSLWWIGSVVWLSLSPADSPPLYLALCLPVRMADDSGSHRGNRWLPVKLHLLPSVENPPHQLYFKTIACTVTAKTLATRRGLSHKTSKASAAMKHKWGGALSIFTALPLSDCSPPPLHTASALFIHFSRRTVGDPKCAIILPLTRPMSDLPHNAAHNKAPREKFYDM